MISTLLLTVLLIAGSWYLYKPSKSLPLPPGPPRLPPIGNLHQAPTKYSWKTIQKWHRQYGPVICLKYGRFTMVSLGTHKAASDLLKHRSGIYSSRPHLTVGTDWVTKNLHIALIPYGDTWRSQRRVLNTVLNVAVSKNYLELQDTLTVQLLEDFLQSNDYIKAAKRYSAGLIMALAYSKQMADLDRVLAAMLDCIHRPTSQLVEVFPPLKYLPRALAPWKAEGDRVFKETLELFARNLEQGKRAPGWNFTKSILGSKEAKNMTPRELAYVLGPLYEGGSETTATVTQVFIFAAVLHPEAVKQAQAELDRAIGPQRLPRTEDSASLPYVNAFVNEVLRWRTPLLGGFPHAVIEDDEYMGYRIPKGATVSACPWALEDDDAIFPNPEQFNPGRWVENPDLPVAAFGFGRRVCPGEHVGRQSLFLIISRMLWAFEFLHAEENGRRVELDPDAMVDHATSPPLPFKAQFRVRSEQHRQAIKEAGANKKDLQSNLASIEEAFRRSGKT